MRDVIIIGAGIGGLTTALACHHFGLRPIVLEQASDISETGAGLQLSPNAMRVFRALDLEDDLIRVAFQPKGVSLRMGESGMRLADMTFDPSSEARWGAPYLHIHRADLVEVLYRTLRKRRPGAVQLNAATDTYRHWGRKVKAVLANGKSITGEALIGADGIHSVVRNRMHGADRPRFTGNVAWRAVVPVSKLGDLAPEPYATAWMGRGKHAVTYLLRGGDLANLVAVVEREDWREEGWQQRGTREEALADFAGWHPTITGILEQADDLFRWALFDRAPLPFWTEGGVTLLGDAAHPMLPFMAQGAAMAIEDAWALAACLNQSADADAALKHYQGLRLRRTSHLQARSRANAKTFHKSSRIGRLSTYGPMWLAGRIAPQLGLRRLNDVYAYDVVEAAARP